MGYLYTMVTQPILIIDLITIWQKPLTWNVFTRNVNSYELPAADNR